MTEEQFDDVINTTLEQSKETLIVKGKEYRRNNNPLHNFDVGANITGKLREEVIWGFALKHFISIQDIRNDMVQGTLPKIEVINEKYGDLINYLLIEKASIIDRIYEHEQDIIDWDEAKDIK